MSIVIETVTIERMRHEHVAEVHAIEKRSFTMPWHSNAFANELSNSSAFYIIAKRAGSIVGFAGMWLIIDEAHITTIAVDPLHRGRHIGDRLVFELLTAAVERRIQRATLEVRESNDAAQALYEKYGFKSVAVRKGYYPDNRENAVVMWTPALNTPEYTALLADFREKLGL